MDNVDAVPANSRYSPALALSGIVVGCAAFNLLFFALMKREPELPDWLKPLLIGVWIFEPMLLAAWAALGPNRLLVRLAVVVPCLLLLIALPGVFREDFHNLERFEFIVFAFAALIIFSVTALLLGMLRWFTGWCIVHDFEANSGARFQFGTRHLLLLTTLYAACLGVATNLVFKQPEPVQFFGPNFVVIVAAIGGGSIFGLLLPCIAVPLFVLHPRPTKRAVTWAVGLWLLLSVVIGVIWLALDGEMPWDSGLLVQLGGAGAGTLSAIALRLAGFQLQSCKPESDSGPVDHPST